MANSNGFAMNLPILDGKNYEHWSIQMKAIFGFQECLDVVKGGMPTADENSVEYREANKRDCKAIFLIHQCVDRANFEKISAASSSKEAWEILEKNYSGGKKIKKVRLLTLKRQYELMQMDEQESIAEYLNRLRSLINQMKGFGETPIEQHVVEKILRTLHPRFDHVVAVIEEAKDLDNLSVDELQGSLEVHEQRFMERQNYRQTDHALSAQFKKKGGPGQNEKFRRDKARCKCTIVAALTWMDGSPYAESLACRASPTDYNAQATWPRDMANFPGKEGSGSTPSWSKILRDLGE
ncbi:PREDICTED: uncharacterized protein LOC109356255 [Lupinus angustifolius]|uniref:uncharacterized protein LOC109356255 n=1 Tax=Lupinus angustifolius TaxID=3871 RepID=UPI00092F25E7|nr:PREDICTED: uncharacterized protein LOC109356255 [Lupinus angustifolius]